MNFLASRRSTVNYAVADPVSPSHAIIQVADIDDSSSRRARKRERRLVKFENERMAVMDSDSPGPSIGEQRSSAGVEIRVTGPAGWAVTETNPRQQKTDEMEDSDEGSRNCSQQPSPLRRGLRTAWSDGHNVESPPIQQNRSMYVNSGYEEASDDDEEEGYSVAEMLAQLQRKTEAAESQLSTWKDIKAAAERDAIEARQVEA